MILVVDVLPIGRTRARGALGQGQAAPGTRQVPPFQVVPGWLKLPNTWLLGQPRGSGPKPAGRNTRRSTSGVFLADRKVAELPQVLEQIGRHDVAEIRTAKVGSNALGCVLTGYFLGGFAGGLAGGYIGGAVRKHRSLSNPA